jgi:hypothetical protein
MNITAITNFISGSGPIALDDKFVSIRLVKEAVQKKFRLAVLEESSTHMKCKIIRYARLYGAPIFFLNATAEFDIKRESDSNTLIINYYWPDYYLVAVAASAAGIISKNISFFLLALVFFGGLVFLDTKWVTSRIRKLISNK